jgi:cell division septation protein DedD
VSDDTLIHAGDDKLIGVGMGGSCPSCRAPIDLGQEFCLECGAPIRFSARQRKGRSATSTTSSSAGAAPTEPRSFPWLPFAIVLALIVGGIAFAVVGTGGDDASSKEPSTKTETALPTITNEAPETTEATDTMGGAAGACATGLPSDASTGAGSSDPNAISGSAGDEQIPEVAPAAGPLGANDPSSDAFPSATPGASDAVPSTNPDGSTSSAADANCAAGADGTTPADSGIPSVSDPASAGLPATTPNASAPPSTTTSTPTIPTSTPAAKPTGTTATSWPAGTDGWTVVVFGYSDQSRANQRAADLQEDGFDSGVLYSSDYGSLCPNFYVVFSGVYTTKAQAENQMKRLQGKYQGMYVKKIAKDGTAQGCSS